ncbi:MAG: hypothetical protein IPL72_13520 [Sulfuritalea sp.]|nr:hypothetical protein [Sulfuritalea sp.]
MNRQEAFFPQISPIHADGAELCPGVPYQQLDEPRVPATVTLFRRNLRNLRHLRIELGSLQ